MRPILVSTVAKTWLQIIYNPIEMEALLARRLSLYYD